VRYLKIPVTPKPGHEAMFTEDAVL
jgi:hypothetical protein